MMFKQLLVKFFGFRIGQVVALGQFDSISEVVSNTNFKAFDATKGNYGYWVLLNSDLNRYVIARKFRI